MIRGGTEWYCNKNSEWIPIHQTGNGNKETPFREGLTLYQTGSIPGAICTEDVFIVVTKDIMNPLGTGGWKSGDLVVGDPSIVASFKTVNDFFSSYFRAFLSVAALVLVLILSNLNQPYVLGTYWYRGSVVLLGIHFFSSSSLLDFLLPGSINLGFPFLMAGGTGGCLFLFLSSLEVWKRKEIIVGRSNREKWDGLTLVAATFIALLFFYSFAKSATYIYVQTVIAVSIVIASTYSYSTGNLVFGLFFLSDVFGVQGFLNGIPTNTATHFLFFSFLYDSFEWIFLNNRLQHHLDRIDTLVGVKDRIAELSERFKISKISASMFTRDFSFLSKDLLSKDSEQVRISPKVSHLAASIMTSRVPALRIEVGSTKSKILKGDDNYTNQKIGREFCIFPLVHNQKVLGTLNITGYSKSELGDPTQMVLFISLVNRLLPSFSEESYREDLSPNIEEQGKILSIESNFISNDIKSKTHVLKSFDDLSIFLDCKIIISKANVEKSFYSTFSSHNYSVDDAKFLETHAPRLEEHLVASPANVALSQRNLVYVNDIPRMFSVYPDFLVQLFVRNSTKTLLVSPILLEGQFEPWGVVWIEFPNRMNRPESDLRELAEFANSSIHRQLDIFFKDEAAQIVNQELYSLVPERVLKKVKLGLDPKEEEYGYILNIDLAGSTKLAGHLGEVDFHSVIKSAFSKLTEKLDRFGFVPQLVIWDAFIFTCEKDSRIFFFRDLEEIFREVSIVVDDLNLTLPDNAKVGFRAIIHFGDITRNWSVGSSRNWTVTGAALAESCKLESEVKKEKRALVISKACVAALGEYASEDLIINKVA